MSCPTQNPRCLDQGYCNCGFYEDSAETAGGCGDMLFLMFIGIFAAFFYPAIRISRSITEYDANDTPRFAGTWWLFSSPVFGFLSNMLYQIVFSVGVCAAEATNSNVTAAIYISGMWSIYALAIGLAILAFIVKNRNVTKFFFIDAQGRSFRKAAVVAGLLFMTLLFFVSIAGVVFAGTNAYFTIQKNIQIAPEPQKPKSKRSHSR